MKQISILLLIVSTFSCSFNKTKSHNKTEKRIENKQELIQKSDSLKETMDVDVAEEYVEENFATYFLVVSDTNLSYPFLLTKMKLLSKKLALEIDTMGRTYNQTKNLIALPDDSEDEMYAGEYFPRRFPSETLSLEYLSFYTENTREKNIALMAGVYESKKSADSALRVLRKLDNNAFIVKADSVYIGCTH
ncbi:MAG TPA: hypothetical protein PLI97_02665 [Fluviicola sp.]|nr:hypothetical protein [Fluviicola sp.]